MAKKIENHNIKELTDYSHIRKRLEMYLGSRDNHTQDLVEFDTGKPILKEMTWTPALYTGFREILDNASDELIGHGFGNRIDVTYDEKTITFSIKDNGRGIPFDFNEERQEHLATMVLTRPRTGRNFDERGNVAGTNGIGSKATSNTSEYMDVEIVRNGEMFRQRFEEDLTGDQLRILDPLIFPTNEKSGTFIKYKPSKSVYHSLTLPLGFVKSRIIEFAAINYFIKVYFNGELIKTKPDISKTLFDKMENFVIDIEDKEEEFKTKFILVPNFTKSDEHYQSVVNNILAFEGGTHMDAFRSAFTRGLISALSRESKKRKLTPNRSDIMERLLVFNITNMKAPTFGSQSKTRLVSEHAGKIVSKYFSDESVFQEIIKKHKGWIDEIYQRCADRTQKKDASEIAKLARKVVRAKVPGLMDATGRDRAKCTLFLAEGLCLQSDTQVRVMRDGEWLDIPIKDVVEGDMVISHTNNLRKVIRTSSSVKNSITIKTKNGEVCGSGDHRMYVYNFKQETFEFVKMSEISPDTHKMIKSKLLNCSGLLEITISNSNNEKYPIRIDYGDNYELSSEDHRYGVFNLHELKYEMVKAIDLNPEIHTMMLK